MRGAERPGAARRSTELGLPDAKVISLDPHTLEEVIGQVETVGTLLDREAEGAELAADLRARVAAVKETAHHGAVRERVRARVVRPAVLRRALDPGDDRDRRRARRSSPRRGSPAARPRGTRSAPPPPRSSCSCRAATTWRRPRTRPRRFIDHPEFADTPAARNGNVFAVDATSYFSRPGPRIVDGLEILAWAAHPDVYPAAARGHDREARLRWTTGGRTRPSSSSIRAPPR